MYPFFIEKSKTIDKKKKNTKLEENRTGVVKMPERFNINFINDQGDFELDHPEQFKRLSFPLLNESGMISSITPDLKGDIKTGQHSFLTVPVSVEDLALTKASRNFWVLLNGRTAWSAAGVSGLENRKQDRVKLQAGLLWHRVMRENRKLKIRSVITNFVPASDEQVELMKVDLTNLSSREITAACFFCLPLFCRSADNLRDHRNVTSLLNRVRTDKYGIVCRPTMLFNEAGHRPNNTHYFVRGFTGRGKAPAGFYPTVMDFTGEAGDFENPEAVLLNRRPVRSFDQGEEAAAGIRFRDARLAPEESVSFIVIMGITESGEKISQWSEKFASEEKFNQALDGNKRYWAGCADRIVFKTGDRVFNSWLRWVSVQPVLRKIAGNSFMPDFDYGKGGRGWRDLWQDLLALLLVDPAAARDLLIGNFGGVRVDGSNATVIGKKPGEFIADRNNVSRVWMDHGVWPFFTLYLYIQQTGDWKILFEKQKYFKDMQAKRARGKDAAWDAAAGNNLLTPEGRVYEGTVLEHILLEHLVQFFNAGEHGSIRLEDADWNDGLDMAGKKGESVAFTAFYAGNMELLAGLLKRIKKEKGAEKAVLLQEIFSLLDAPDASPDYSSPDERKKRLDEYLEKTKSRISGRTAEADLDDLADDLLKKASFLKEHIGKNEWIRDKKNFGWFNGYYDNEGKRVEGDFPRGARMTLTGQVFPVMFNIPDNEQLSEVQETVRKYLWDKKMKGLRLNTDFREVRPDLGRAFAFAFGHKENGAFFSHMNVMMAYALYSRGLAKEGFAVLHSVFEMARRWDKSRIYPGIPEYFGPSGRGHYHYLTGSASWFVFTMLTRVYGIRGEWGGLRLAPRLVREQFDKNGEAFCETAFAGRRIRALFQNPGRLDAGRYGIGRILINEVIVPAAGQDGQGAVIALEDFLKMTDKELNMIRIELKAG